MFKDVVSSFRPVFVDDIYEDTSEVSVVDDLDHDVTGYDGSHFVSLNTGDMQFTPKQARELAAALILAAEECEDGS